MKVNFDIKLTKGQQAAYDMAHDKDIKILVMCFSRQAGKSVLCEILLIEQLFKPNRYSAYISPTFQLGRKVFKELTQLLEPTGIIQKANASTLTIESIYGSTLQFFSGEAAAAIRGTTVSGLLVIDEAAYIPDQLPNGEEFWGNIVMPITKARHPKVILVSTPQGKKGFYYDHYLRALAGEEGIAQLTRTIYDDSLVTPEEIEEIRRSIPPKAFQQEFECQFLDSSLTFFEGFEHCFDSIAFNRSKQWMGVDISANGEDATIVAMVDDEGNVRTKAIEGTLDDKYKKISDIINTEHPTCIYMENNGVGTPMINEVRKLVRNKGSIIEWTTTNSSKEEIVSKLAVDIANRAVHFSKDDGELFAEMGTFVVKLSKTKKMTFGALSGKHDDRVMAVAIALQCKEDAKMFRLNNNRFIRMKNNAIR